MTNDELAAVLAKLDTPNEFPSVLAIWPRWADGGVEVCLGTTAFWRTVKRLGVAVTSPEPPDRLSPQPASLRPGRRRVRHVLHGARAPAGDAHAGLRAPADLSEAHDRD